MSAKKASNKDDGKTTKPGLPALFDGSLGRVSAVASALIAFVGIVLLYHTLFVPADEGTATAEAAQAAAQPAASEVVEEKVSGVEDPWTYSGTFSTGNEELDGQVKAFCDAFSADGLSAEENAHNVYNTIVWGAYSERDASEKPAGTNWDSAAARHYFSTANIEVGEAGEGDFYDQAAAASYCLRYFGYSDAIAVPIISQYTGESGGALCLLSDANGYGRVCDPSLGAEGWMLDRYMYSIVAENIGQDLTSVQALGIEVQEVQTEQGQQPEQQPIEDAQTTDYGYDYGSGNDYGYESSDYDQQYDGSEAYDGSEGYESYETYEDTGEYYDYGY